MKELKYDQIEKYLESNLLDNDVIFEEYEYSYNSNKRLILKLSHVPIHKYIKENEFIDREEFERIYGLYRNDYEMQCVQPYLRIAFDITDEELEYSVEDREYKVVNLNPIFINNHMQRFLVEDLDYEQD